MDSVGFEPFYKVESVTFKINERTIGYNSDNNRSE